MPCLVALAPRGFGGGAVDGWHRCSRLGLTPLSYLWQRDQRSLLAEMVAAGVEARIIKVAGYGTEHAAQACWPLATQHSSPRPVAWALERQACT